MATVYIWENKQWHKIATYDKETAIKCVNDITVFFILGGFDLCAIDNDTGEIIASNSIEKINKLSAAV